MRFLATARVERGRVAPWTSRLRARRGRRRRRPRAGDARGADPSSCSSLATHRGMRSTRPGRSREKPPAGENRGGSSRPKTESFTTRANFIVSISRAPRHDFRDADWFFVVRHHNPAWTSPCMVSNPFNVPVPSSATTGMNEMAFPPSASSPSSRRWPSTLPRRPRLLRHHLPYATLKRRAPSSSNRRRNPHR